MCHNIDVADSAQLIQLDAPQICTSKVCAALAKLSDGELVSWRQAVLDSLWYCTKLKTLLHSSLQNPIGSLKYRLWMPVKS